MMKSEGAVEKCKGQTGVKKMKVKEIFFIVVCWRIKRKKGRKEKPRLVRSLFVFDRIDHHLLKGVSSFACRFGGLGGGLGLDMTRASARRSVGSTVVSQTGIFAFVGRGWPATGFFGRGGLGGFVSDEVELENIEMAKVLVVDVGECATYECTGSDGRRRSVGPARCVDEITIHIEIDDKTPLKRRALAG
jgi:hypothetical protein